MRPAAAMDWPRSATYFLLGLGIVLAVVSFAVVMTMPDLIWHPWRDAELRATYDAYVQTGTLLIKETGTGSNGVQAPAAGPLTFAAWDDDPGSYILASLMSHVTGSDSPYPGLRLAQAVLVAIPLIWLPYMVARVVGRARAGFALVVLPLVLWLFNHGAVLLGTEYGLSDEHSPTPVYSLYGTAASLAFVSLSLLLLLSTYRLRLTGLVFATLGIGVLAAVGNLARAQSGYGIAAAVAVLWWVNSSKRWRWPAAIGGALIACLVALALQNGVMGAINVARADTTGETMEVPDAHTAWHSMYLGLSYPAPITGEPSRFGVEWADGFATEQALKVDPDVQPASTEYDQVMRGIYFDTVLSDPLGAVKLYIHKLVFVVEHFAGMLLVIAAGFTVGLWRRGRMRSGLLRILWMVAPLLALGLIPPVLVMPLLYYFSELSAGLGLLTVVALGVLVWAVTSWPSRIRAAEWRRDLAAARPDRGVGVSAIVRGSDEPAPPAAELDAIVPSGTSIATFRGSSPAEEAESLRAAVSATKGERLLLVLRPTTLQGDSVEDALGRDADVVVIGGSTAGGDAASNRLARAVMDEPPSGDVMAIVADGEWVRRFARLSRESGTAWVQELLFAARRNGLEVSRLPAGPDAPVESGGVVREALALMRVQARRDEYDAIGEPARVGAGA